MQAVLQDLFPGVEIPEHDYGRLQEEIVNALLARHLQPVPQQVLKVIQLYETMLVRHGVMLVGPTGSGKTTVYQVMSADFLRVMNKLWVGGRHDMPPPLSSHGRRSASRGRADGNVAAVSHGQYVPTLTAAATLEVYALRPR